jgi:hypothetical protein
LVSMAVGSLPKSMSMGPVSVWTVIFAVRWTYISRRLSDVEDGNSCRLSLVVTGMIHEI